MLVVVLQALPLVVSAVATHWTAHSSGKVWTVPGSGCSGALRLSVILRLTLIPIRPV